MAAYLDGTHHPRQALPPRIAFVALIEDDVIGYIAGHATTRYDCSGEVQYLYVAPSYRRSGVGTRLLRELTRWFSPNQIRRVCVNADLESEGAVAFYVAQGAVALNKHWYVWEDITVLLDAAG